MFIPVNILLKQYKIWADKTLAEYVLFESNIIGGYPIVFFRFECSHTHAYCIAIC